MGKRLRKSFLLGRHHQAASLVLFVLDVGQDYALSHVSWRSTHLGIGRLCLMPLHCLTLSQIWTH